MAASAAPEPSPGGVSQGPHAAPAAAGRPGTLVELEETAFPTGESFKFSILGPHDAEVGELVGQLRAHAEAELARRYPGVRPPSAPAGRGPDEVPGWRFRLVIEGRSLDVRPDADVLAFPPARPIFR